MADKNDSWFARITKIVRRFRVPAMRIYTPLHPRMKTRPWPLASHGNVAMPNRVVMNVIQVPMEIAFIPNDMIIEPPLPQIPPLQTLPLPVVAYRQLETCDQRGNRVSPICLQQPVKMIIQDHVSEMPKRTK